MDRRRIRQRICVDTRDRDQALDRVSEGASSVSIREVTSSMTALRPSLRRRMMPHKERVVLVEAAGQRPHQHVGFEAWLLFGRIGEDLRSVHPRSEPPASPVRTPRGCRWPRPTASRARLQHLLQPLQFTTAFAGRRGPIPGEIPQSRIGSGGTREARSNPHSVSWPSHAESLTSILRPGGLWRRGR